MITLAVSWIAVVSWVGVGAVLLSDHVAKVAIPDDLVIGSLGVACTSVVVRAVLSLRAPTRDYDDGWRDCQRSFELAVARERERDSSPLPW